MNNQLSLNKQWVVLIAAGCTVASLSVWALSAKNFPADIVMATAHESPECASLARAVANRNHSMMEGAAARATVNQAYQICMSDPAAFRRMLR